jgi:hypothetical protein
MLQMLKKLDIKSILIIILATLLIILTVFQPNKKIDYYKNEIELLHKSNAKLLYSNDSLKLVNKGLDKELTKIYGVIKLHETLILKYNNTINDLKQQQDETTNRINILNADGVATEFTNYLKKRSSKSIRK